MSELPKRLEPVTTRATMSRAELNAILGRFGYRMDESSDGVILEVVDGEVMTAEGVRRVKRRSPLA
jgi:hypothetical protein